MTHPDAEPSSPPNSENQRLVALDAFRGITMLAMVLVNNPGSWDEGKRYAPLDHADWFGWTPTDLVFPFFVFIVGTALAYSLRKYQNGAAVAPAVYWRIARRTLTLILLGIGLDLFGHACAMWFGDETSLRFDTLRYPGVLQRIAVAYCATSLIALHVGVRGQVAIAAVLLLGYAAMLTWLPKPHDKAANLSREGNIVRVVDSKFMSVNHIYTQGTTEKTDPEGLLSNLPAIVTSILGYWCGLAIQRRGVNWRTVAALAACGAVLAVLGLAWNPWMPIGKKLWTSSFVLLTGGLAMIALAACLGVFDVAGWRRLARPFEVVGVNAITVYVGSSVMEHLVYAIRVRSGDESASLQEAMFNGAFANMFADVRAGSLAMAIVTVAIWWAIAWGLTRTGWKVRV
jgi:predicted acyltransferase